jgi:hypothetical protein
LIEWVLGTELLAEGSPRGTPTIPKISLWSIGRIGRSIAWCVEFFPRAVFFPTVQAKPVWPVSQTGLTGLALWAVVKSFWARKSLSCYFRTMCGSRTGGWSLPLCDEWLTTLCGLILG